MTSCSTTSSGRGTATIVKSDGRVTYRTMNKTKCAKKRLRVAKRNYYRNQRDY